MTYQFRCRKCEHEEERDLDPNKDDLLKQVCSRCKWFTNRVFSLFNIHYTFKPGVDHSTQVDYQTKAQRDKDYAQRGLVPYQPVSV